MTTELSDNPDPSKLPSQDLVPPHTEVVLTTKKSATNTVLGIAALLIIGISTFGAYYLITKANNPSTSPIPQSQTLTETLGTTSSSTETLKATSVEEIKNSYIYIPYVDPFFYLPSENNRYVLLQDGVTTLKYCEGGLPCDISASKNLTVRAHTITLQKDLVLVSQTESGVVDGVIILEFDFENAAKKYYLGTFRLSILPQGILGNGKSEKITYVEIAKNLGDLKGEIRNINIATKGEITFDIETPSHVIKKTYFILSGDRFSDLIEISKDKMRRKYEDIRLGYAFWYPAENQPHYNKNAYGLRALPLEKTLGISPIYFAAGCGLQPTLGDSGNIIFWKTEQNSTSTHRMLLNGYLTAHRMSTSTVYLTTPLYGYDPVDWDSVREKVFVQEYAKKITSGDKVSGKSIVLETIAGLSVRHILPFESGRTCNDQILEQYQWVKNGVLFNFIFTEYKSEPSSIKEKKKLIESILSTLEVQ